MTLYHQCEGVFLSLKPLIVFGRLTLSFQSSSDTNTPQSLKNEFCSSSTWTKHKRHVIVNLLPTCYPPHTENTHPISFTFGSHIPTDEKNGCTKFCASGFKHFFTTISLEAKILLCHATNQKSPNSVFMFFTIASSNFEPSSPNLAQSLFG